MCSCEPQPFPARAISAARRSTRSTVAKRAAMSTPCCVGSKMVSSARSTPCHAFILHLSTSAAEYIRNLSPLAALSPVDFWCTVPCNARDLLFLANPSFETYVTCTLVSSSLFDSYLAGAFPALDGNHLSMFMLGIYTDPLKPDRLLFVAAAVFKSFQAFI